MKKAIAIVLALVINMPFTSAFAVTESQKNKLTELAFMLEIMASEYDFGDEFRSPDFAYEEDTNQFIMVFESKSTDGETGRIMSKIVSGAYDSFLELCTDGYELIKDATQEIAEDILIVVGITGNDQGIIMYTLNGVDFTDIVVE